MMGRQDRDENEEEAQQRVMYKSNMISLNTKFDDEFVQTKPQSSYPSKTNTSKHVE